MPSNVERRPATGHEVSRVQILAQRGRKRDPRPVLQWLSVRGGVPCLLLALVMLLQAGCAGLSARLQPAEPLVKPPASTAEAIEIAREISRRGRWAEAMRYLESAALSLDDKVALLYARKVMENDWRREQQAIEDMILAGDAESLRNKVELLERLSVAQPDDLVLTSRRIFWKETLAGKAGALASCAERHVGERTELARRCYDVVSWMPPVDGIEERLAAVDEQLRNIADVAERRRKANRERERQARARVLLNDARASIEAHNYRKALDTLDRVDKLQPDSHEVAGLKQEALSMISPQVEALIKLGDHLYLDEQLEAAVATWQAALTLNPEDADIVARIERAKTVLGKLEALRRQQRVPADPQP